MELPQFQKMRCDKGCTECCTITGGTTEEYSKILAYAKERGIQPRRQRQLCPWYHDGRCSVYEVRPVVCRLYGHIERMTCPRGYNTNVKPKVERRLMREYVEETRSTGSAPRFLHEVVYTIAEIKLMMPPGTISEKVEALFDAQGIGLKGMKQTPANGE